MEKPIAKQIPLERLDTELMGELEKIYKEVKSTTPA